MCTDGQPRTSRVCRRHTQTHVHPRDVLCVLKESHGRPVYADDQRADMCTDGQPRRPVCADGHTRTRMHSHGRHVCADGHTLTHTDSHGRPRVCWADSHGHPVCTEQTAHVGQNHPNSPRKGQRAES
ncbi:unnamed protein product [Brassica rapa]|uniref:Uncharacterized protein n=1 Tax=Brassica campestris TaxID=3711 RepID=A0A8D9CUF6_BRACM|nr:unnamed protein product [Brassica rapa]